MKLIMAIVQDNDAQHLISNLIKNGFQSTKLASTGGFLRSGNTTLMIGTDDSKLQKAMDIIEKTCKSRKQISTVPPPVNTNAPQMNPYPVEVSIGGATVFVLNIEESVKF